MVGGLLPLALVVAISPTTLTVVILILLSRRRPVVSVVFAVGYVLGIAVGATLLLALGAAGMATSNNAGVVAWLQLVVGLLLLLYGLERWTKRPKPGEDLPAPKWMTAMEDLTVVKSALVSLVLSALRPKNVLMFAAAAVTIGSGHLPIPQDAIAIAIFTVISASTVVVLVVGAVIRQEQLNPTLTWLRAWLQANTVAMMSVLFLLVGVVEIGRGIGGIF